MQLAELGFDLNRLPKDLQPKLRKLYEVRHESRVGYLKPNRIYEGDACQLLQHIEPNSISLSTWSPPYFVGKEYEANLTFGQWKHLLSTVIQLHFPIIKPGNFLVINIADILVFKDPSMPRIQADVIGRKCSVTLEDVLRVKQEYPHYSRYEIAKVLGCSEQTVDRRLHGNNIRGGKHHAQTRIKIVGGMIEQWAIDAGFYPYDRRVWVKDAAWENSRWASLSYRSVDEFEYIYFFWKPGITRYDRARLNPEEWKDWGSRGVWVFPSVRANDDHESKFPLELPLRVIRLLTDPGDIVLDCFLGSGTTAVAALKTQRQYIGIEIKPEYAKLSRRRINAQRKQLC